MDGELFEVQASSTRYSPFVGGNRQIIYHGVNKSGSLVLSNVLRAGYQAAGREGEFHSRYHKAIRPKSLDAFIRIADEAREPGFFVSHNLWGALRASPDRIFITQFRHPLPRIVSAYHWLKNKHERARQEDPSLRPYPSLEDFVKRSKGVRHSQVAQFAAGYGANGMKARKQLTAKQLLPLAKDAIHSGVYAVGLAERSEESIFMFAHLCGLPRVPGWRRDERNRNRPHVSQLRPEEIELIQEVFAREFRFYHWVVERFEEQLSHFEFGPSLERYKAACEGQYKDRLLWPGKDAVPASGSLPPRAVEVSQ